MVAAGYGFLLFAAALIQPIRRRAVAVAGTAAYACVALGAGSAAPGTLWVTLLVPGGLLLTGYWLSGFFFRDPQPGLESWLMAVDRAVGAERWLRRLPRVLQELLELAYALDYVVIGGGAIYAATVGSDVVSAYWSLVLAAELASFALLPWLRSRPPRVIELLGVLPGNDSRRGDTANPARELIMRRLNVAILDSASVQANTLPSGHVSGAVAAALAVATFDPGTGLLLMGMAVLIAVAAIAGRYHYVVDCVSGAAVAAALSSLM
jgi:hypothetical protein